MPPTSKWINASHDEPVAVVASRSLEARLATVAYYLPLATRHAEDDVEYVHQLRVSSRRAVAAIRLYSDWLPNSGRRKVTKLLGRIRRAANDARDDDVLAMRLEQDQQHVGAAHLLERVRAHRAKSQLPLSELWDDLDAGGKFERRVKKLRKRLAERAAADANSDSAFAPWARRILWPYADQFFHDSREDLSEYHALHQFRISGKKLRYTMELVAGAFPLRFKEQLYGQVESLQDRLGEINDLVIAQIRYERWIDETDESCEIEYLRHLQAEEEDRLAQRRREFFDWWTLDRAERLADAFRHVVDVPSETSSAASGA
jgi:CHAD domain-containing protein